MLRKVEAREGRSEELGEVLLRSSDRDGDSPMRYMRRSPSPAPGVSGLK